MAPRRKFGYVRRLPSGKWQASYLGPDGERHAAEVTFPSEVDAERYLAMTAKQIRSGDWTDLRQLGRRTLRGVPGREPASRKEVGRDVQAQHAPAPRRAVGPAHLPDPSADGAGLA